MGPEPPARRVPCSPAPPCGKCAQALRSVRPKPKYLRAAICSVSSLAPSVGLSACFVISTCLSGDNVLRPGRRSHVPESSSLQGFLACGVHSR